MPYLAQSPATRPAFPACPVGGHAGHALDYCYTVEQAGTGDRAYMLGCPSGRYRFLHLPSTGAMIRYTRPRYGWAKTPPLTTA